MKIIFITSTPLPNHIGKLMNFNDFLKLKIDVEIWNLENFFFKKKNIKMYYQNKKLNFKFKKYYKISNLRTLDNKLKNNKKNIFIHLSKYNQTINDDMIINKLNKLNINYLAANFDPRKLFYSFKDLIKLPIRFFKKKNRYKNFFPKAVITSGNIGDFDSNLYFPRSKIISISSIKIDWNRSKKIFKKNYICFIDENIGFSPDSKLLNYQVSNNVSLYYKNLNKLFNKIEKWYKINIIICASGRHKYKNQKKFFESRRIVYGKTLKLIKNSKFVIGHGSLAFDQAIVSKKHILTIDDKSFTKIKKLDWPHYDSFLKNKRLLINEIQKKDIDNLLKIDLNYYDYYIESFLRKKKIKNNFAYAINKYLINNFSH